jgi:hypothetical protein
MAQQVDNSCNFEFGRIGGSHQNAVLLLDCPQRAAANNMKPEGISKCHK